MLSRTSKATYYALLYYPMRVNALRHRLFPRSNSPPKIHLGPGRGNYLNGWTNVDANFVTCKLDIWADLRAKLPFRRGTVEAFYSHHVIEHLPDALLPFHFGEMFRCLRPSGVIRIGGPNTDTAIRKFTENDLDWFGDFPDTRRSIGGRFANFILCRGEHLTILTSSYLRELAEDAGFDKVAFCKPVCETQFPLIFDHTVLSKEWESTYDFPHTIVMEAQKPPSMSLNGR
jgi:predicted SAM-dependent methyltransferase